MQPQTHILTGWCLGNWFPFTPRQRLMCMIASAIPDLDGMGIIAGQEYYWRWHHVLGHNLALGLLSSGVMALLGTKKLLAFAVYLGLFHLHLVMDFFGSGRDWCIYYLWPTPCLWPRQEWLWLNPWRWDFYSWQNISIFYAMFVWTVIVAYRQKRTPLETMMPKLDAELVRRLRREKVVLDGNETK